MSYTYSWSPGDWLALCDRCGRKFKASKLKKTWDGLMVDADCYETRHPQDLMRPPAKDDQSVPWTRSEPTDVEIGPTYIAETVGSQDRTIPSGTNNGEL